MTVKYICEYCSTKQRTKIVESMLRAGFELHHIECKECGRSQLKVVESDDSDNNTLNYETQQENKGN